MRLARPSCINTYIGITWERKGGDVGMAKSGNLTALVAERRKRSGLIGRGGRLLDRHYNYTTILCFLTLAGGAFPPRCLHELPTWLKLVAHSAVLLAIKSICSSRAAHIFSIRAICVSTNDSHTFDQRAC